MDARLEIEFVPLDAALERTVVVLAGTDLNLGARAAELNERTGKAIERAAGAADFKGRAKSVIELLAPPKLDAARLLVVGSGNLGEATDLDRIALGGYALGQIAARKSPKASLIAELPKAGDRAAAELAADLAFGAVLRSYTFRKFMTKRTDDAGNGHAAGGNGETAAPERDGVERLKIHVGDPDAARTAFERRRAIADGVSLARDLVNEPANELGPVEFAETARALEALGVEVEVLDRPALEQIGMRTLLGVADGSVRPPRVVIMHWHGAKSKRTKPLCFIGKGVVFDTGGISIKPAAGMEDMKGDMAGAACVVGLMHALAARKAPVNVVGLIGLVENMPSGSAQRPGDIVRSLSGQTIEVINTDAEGRLVLADLLWYAQDRFKPRFMINLATLTGAILVALGKEHAGLFTNDDKLAEDLAAAGEATGEKVWRMPLGKAYDKMLESRFADMKNIGGRFAGSITAAQFLQRFVNGVQWAHLDIAGTAMDSPKSDINHSWASGWGVRLLDRLVADKHEKG
ncbi:MAG: leucyl aminopeptidase [Hyphomicrobiaceae bacterium]